MKALVAMPGLQCNLNYGDDDAGRGEEALGALPVLLVALQAPLQVRDAPAVTIAHQSRHLGF